MKFGHFSHVWNKPGMTPADRYQQLWRELALCDELGFEYAFAVEHHFRPHESWMPSPAAYCAAAAAHTKRLRIGPMGYLVPVYDPLRILEEVAVLDNVLEGRLELGLVSGILPEYFPPYRADYDNRAALTNETLALVKTAFGSEGPFSFEGPFHRYENVTLNVRPMQKPHPPMWLESRTPETLEMLAREGVHTGYTFFSHRPEVVPAYEEYLRLWRTAGHVANPNINYWALVYVGESDGEARETVREHVRHTFTRVFFANEGDVERAAARREARGEKMGAEIARHLADSDYLIDHTLMFAGSAATVAQQIREAAQEGMFNTLFCELNFGALPEDKLMASIERFGRDVLPALRDFEPF